MSYIYDISTLRVNLLIRLKSSSFQYGFQLGEEKGKVLWVQRLGDKSRLMFCEKITNQQECTRALSWFFSSLPLSAFSSPSDNIPCSPSGHEVEIHNELHPHNKKKKHSITSTLHWTCRAFSSLMFLRPTVKTGHLFRHHSRDPKFHHLSRCSLKSFHQHPNSQQALYWHQHNYVSDLHSAGAAQIWLQHNACQNFQWEAHDMRFLKFQLPLLLYKLSMDNGTNHLPTFLDVPYIFLCWR